MDPHLLMSERASKWPWGSKSHRRMDSRPWRYAHGDVARSFTRSSRKITYLDVLAPLSEWFIIHNPFFQCISCHKWRYSMQLEPLFFWPIYQVGPAPPSIVNKKLATHIGYLVYNDLYSWYSYSNQGFLFEQMRFNWPIWGNYGVRSLGGLLYHRHLGRSAVKLKAS